LGQTRKSGDAITTSALPPTADIPEPGYDVRKVPKTEVTVFAGWTCDKSFCHSFGKSCLAQTVNKYLELR
jgi:hypothetical protein